MMPNIGTKSIPIWIIGYGNPHRGDDGVGAYVVAELNKSLGGKPGIRTLVVHQLGPELIFDLWDAKLIVFVDATVDELKEGLKWTLVEPELKNLPYLSHHFNPGLLCGLLHSLYSACPEAWLVSIEGRNFDIGEGLTKTVMDTAYKAVEEIKEFIERDCFARNPITGKDLRENQKNGFRIFQ
jgi:hydrogenase maturation protease